MGSPVLILNNLTAIVAGVGAVLGIIAIFGSKRVLAIIGTALCVAGIAITVVVQQQAVEELDGILNGETNQGKVSDASSEPEAEQQQASAGALTWGKRYTWDNGLAVEISAPTACTPSEYAMPQDVVRAVKFTVTVVNGTEEAFDAMMLSVGGDAQFNGSTAEAIFDSNGECGDGGMEAATVMPGKTFTYEAAYSVGEQPGEMQLALQPNFGGDKAVFSGQA
ncbi:hypothetical protein [Amycolatopsis palatopharyngis]|uniref:hypothetical protein n=1 Tax=Amycolatopsis palatopharyngis TaxID=187982 RepID=UPI0013BE9636|nr:hypothetical protein [Amycolatopsis palatopharyngis]